jgi:ubiquinone/menaquinone biosynthesis C-methylase UbiE
MKINYQETSEDLATRINIHEKYGSRDIDQWMLELVDPPRGAVILDIGCGAGKQLKAFHTYLEGDGELIGGDVSEELLAKARQLNKELGNPFDIKTVDFNKTLPFETDRFNLVSCCFAIYYAENIPFTIQEIHRVLKSGGQFFSTGPMPENKQLFYDVIQEATGMSIPPMPGSSRYGSEILDAVKATFSEVKVEIFENPLVFDEVKPFIDYTRASLSEDRKIWGDLFQGENQFEDVMQKITAVAEKRLRASDDGLTMTKVVGGFVATK